MNSIRAYMIWQTVWDLTERHGHKARLHKCIQADPFPLLTMWTCVSCTPSAGGTVTAMVSKNLHVLLTAAMRTCIVMIAGLQQVSWHTMLPASGKANLM